jgi:hypothetical protein
MYKVGSGEELLLPVGDSDVQVDEMHAPERCWCEAEMQGAWRDQPVLVKTVFALLVMMTYLGNTDTACKAGSRRGCSTAGWCT